MLSFIIIGKNEGKTIKLSIESVLNVIENSSFIESEILYIDSKSSDNTIDIVKAYPQIKCFKISGKCNAAIARNIGAIESKGDILCFIDADMELQVEFIQAVIYDNKLIYPFISGQLKNYFYNNSKDWFVLSTNYLHKNLTQDKYEVTTGGYFIINRETWFSVDGMKTKYRRSQDLDFSLRLAKKGVKLVRKNILMVNHHTIDYHNNERRWKMLFDGSLLFMTSVLYRDHLFNKYIYKRILRNSYSLAFLLLSIVLAFFSIELLLIHPSLLFLRILMQESEKKISEVLQRFVYFYLLDVLVVLGFFIFYPEKITMQYKKVI